MSIGRIVGAKGLLIRVYLRLPEMDTEGRESDARMVDDELRREEQLLEDRVVLGLGFIVLIRALLQHDEHPAVFASMGGFDACKALLIVGTMTLHSFTEGIGVGVSFGGGQGLGLFITLAIAIHNIPEWPAISLVLVPRGVGVGRAALWSIFSSLPQPLMAVPAFLFVALFEPLLPIGLGFAGGAMIRMVFSELVPDALDDTSSNIVAVVVTLSVAAMVVFQFLIR